MSLLDGSSDSPSVEAESSVSDVELAVSDVDPAEESTQRAQGNGFLALIPFLADLGLVWAHLRWRFLVLVMIGVVEAVLESVGLLMFIPLLRVSGFAPNQGGDGALASSVASKTMNRLTDGLDLGQVLLVIAGIFAVKGVVVFMAVAYRSLSIQDCGFRLRTEFLDLVEHADYPVLVGQGPRLAHEMAAELQRSMNALRWYAMAFGMLLKVALLGLVAFLIAPQIGAFFVVLAVGSTWVVRDLIHRAQRTSREGSTRLADYSIRVAEAVRSVKFLRATGRFSAMKRRVTKDARASLVAERRLGMLGAVQRAVQEPLVVATMCVVLYVAHQVFALELTILVASSLFLYRCVMELDRFQMVWQNYAQSRGSIEILDARRSELQAAQSTTEVAMRGDGRYEDIFGTEPPRVDLIGVSYQYSDSRQQSPSSGAGDLERASVLKELDWSVEAGAFVAIVGESGSGKTTMLDVVAGLLQPTTGSVEVAGVNVDRQVLGVLRSGLGYVTQTPFVFQGTVLENLAFGNGEVTREEVEGAARAAHCDEFIRNLPSGYDTIVGEEGQQLSGGQAQLLSIARELVRRPRLLLLDEPTSALDAESEDQIQQTLEELRGSVTLVVVSHRLATVRRADRIAFLDGGRVLEEGPFEQLRAEDGSRFGRFCDLQGVL